MKFRNKTYKSKYGDRIYVEYYDEQRNEKYTNAEYYILDLKNRALIEKLNNIGGFCANIMYRILEEKEIENVEKIMFACTPKETNQFVFLILYLNSNGKIMLTLRGDNYFDWKYFKNKFEEAILEEGFVYDLEGYKNLKPLINEIENKSSKDFGVIINGNQIEYNQILLLNDISSIRLKDDKDKETLKALGSKSALLRFCNSLMGGIHLEICFIDSEDNLISYYQIEDPNITIEQYYENLSIKMKSKYKEGDCDIDYIVRDKLKKKTKPMWTSSIPIKLLTNLSNNGLLSIIDNFKYGEYINNNNEKYKDILGNNK